MPTPTNFEERTVRSAQDLKEILDQISFTRTVVDFQWRFGIKEVAVNSEDSAPRTAWIIWGEFQRPDTNTGILGWGRGRDELVYEGALESSVVKTAWVVVEMLIKHELMEGFRYKNKRPFDPHNQIQALNSLQEGRED